MIAPFLRDKYGWIDSDSCWCGGGGQSREHLFKECRTWKEEIGLLWKEVGEISGTRAGNIQGKVYKGRKGFCFGMLKKEVGPGNTSVGKLLADFGCVEAVLNFWRIRGWEKLKKE